MSSAASSASPASLLRDRIVVIAAAVVWIVGTLIGSVILGVLSTGLILMNVPFFTQLLIKGVVIILAVAIDSLKQRQFMLARLFKR